MDKGKELEGTERMHWGDWEAEFTYVEARGVQ